MHVRKRGDYLRFAQMLLNGDARDEGRLHLERRQWHLVLVDPQERLAVVVGTAAPGDIRKYYREQMGALVYGAMTELRRPR